MRFVKSDSIHEQSAGLAPADYTARITPADPVTVGQYGTWDIVLTVGAQGIALGLVLILLTFVLNGLFHHFQGRGHWVA